MPIKFSESRPSARLRHLERLARVIALRRTGSDLAWSAFVSDASQVVSVQMIERRKR